MDLIKILNNFKYIKIYISLQNKNLNYIINYININIIRKMKNKIIALTIQQYYN